MPADVLSGGNYITVGVLLGYQRQAAPEDHNQTLITSATRYHLQLAESGSFLPHLLRGKELPSAHSHYSSPLTPSQLLPGLVLMYCAVQSGDYFLAVYAY